MNRPSNPSTIADKANVFCYVVFITHKIGESVGDLKNLTSRKINCSTTPVIRGIMSLTVSSVKAFFNNVVSEKASQP